MQRRRLDKGSPSSSQGSPVRRKRDGGHLDKQEARGEGIAKERDPSANVLKTEESMANRFREERIEVDSWEGMPQCVFLVHSPHRTKKFNVIQGDGPAIPEEFREKWNDIEDDSILGEMKFIESKINTTAEMMHFDIETKPRSWKCEVPAEEEKVEKTRKRHKAQEDGDLKDAVYKECCEVLGTLQGTFQKCPSLHTTNLLTSMAQFITNIKSDQRWNKPAKTQLDTLLDTLTYELQTRMVSALVHGMKNSKGRRFMESLLALASRICFGPTCREESEVIGVGTSNVKYEGFPMSFVSEGKSNREWLIDNTEMNLSQIMPKPSPEPLSSPPYRQGSRQSGRLSAQSTPRTSRAASPSSGRVLSSGAATKSIPCGRIYPDCVVASMSDFARYLIVAEVKHSDSVLTTSQMAQLYREMIGAGVHQSEVFGLIVTSSEARILRMNYCDHRRTLWFSAEQRYTFGLPQSDDRWHFKDSFLKFFRDIIAIFDYGSKHIVEVSHFQTQIEEPLVE